MIDWRKRGLAELLREEFERRGFYLVGSEPVEWAPMLCVFKTHRASVRFLELESEDYKYVAYKNLSAAVGTDAQDVITACLFIKIGSNKRAEVNPMTELMAFYRGRLYKYVSLCQSFFFRMGYVRSTGELKETMKEIWNYAELAVETWQRSIRTLIMENRWPEEEYISDIKFLEDEGL